MQNNDIEKQLSSIGKQLKNLFNISFQSVACDMLEFDDYYCDGMIETLTKIKNDNLSLARFGDGEIGLCIYDTSFSTWQEWSADLQDELRRILSKQVATETLIVTLPGAKIENGWWREYWGKNWFILKRLLNKSGAKYGNTAVSRPECFTRYGNKAVMLWKSIWEYKDVIFVTG